MPKLCKHAGVKGLRTAKLNMGYVFKHYFHNAKFHSFKQFSKTLSFNNIHIEQHTSL